MVRAQRRTCGISVGRQVRVCEVSRKRAAQHDVDLVAVELVVVGQGEHDQVERVADELHLRALVALDDVLDDQRVQAQASSRSRRARLDASCRVDPERRRVAEAARTSSTWPAMRAGRPAQTTAGDRRGAAADAPWQLLHVQLSRPSARQNAAPLPCALSSRPSVSRPSARMMPPSDRLCTERGRMSQCRHDGDQHHDGRDEEEPGQDARAAWPAAQRSSASTTKAVLQRPPWSAGGRTASRAAWSVRTTLAPRCGSSRAGQDGHADGHARETRLGHARRRHPVGAPAEGLDGGRGSGVTVRPKPSPKRHERRRHRRRRGRGVLTAHQRQAGGPERRGPPTPRHPSPIGAR